MLRALRIIMITQSQPLAHQQGWWLIGTVFLKCPHRLHCIASTERSDDRSRAISCRCVCRRSPPFWFWRVILLLIVILFAIRSLYRRLVRPLIAVPSSFLNIQSSVTWSSDKYDITFRFHKTRRIQVKKGNIQTLICRILPSWHRRLSRITSWCTRTSIVPFHKKEGCYHKKVLQETQIYTSEGSQFSP